MSNRKGPPPPLGSHPSGIDITEPKHALNTKDWIETPKEFSEAFTSNSAMNRRKKIDHTYQQVGNVLTWERYITFGYHVHDYCFQYETPCE